MPLKVFSKARIFWILFLYSTSERRGQSLPWPACHNSGIWVEFIHCWVEFIHCWQWK